MKKFYQLILIWSGSIFFFTISYACIFFAITHNVPVEYAYFLLLISAINLLPAVFLFGYPIYKLLENK